MKNSLKFLIILILASCGPVELEVTDGQGLRRIEEINSNNRLDNYELEALREVCNHLKVKDNYFQSSVINFNRQFEYLVTKKNCSESSGETNEVTLSLLSVGTNVFFDKVSGTGDFFSNYESNAQGIIAPFCNKLYTTMGSFERFILSGNKISWLYLTAFNQTYCPESNSTYCVIIENGETLNTEQAKVVDRHSMAISKSVGQKIEGMVIGRKYESSVGCDEGYRTIYSKLTF